MGFFFPQLVDAAPLVNAENGGHVGCANSVGTLFNPLLGTLRVGGGEWGAVCAPSMRNRVGRGGASEFMLSNIKELADFSKMAGLATVAFVDDA